MNENNVLLLKTEKKSLVCPCFRMTVYLPDELMNRLLELKKKHKKTLTGMVLEAIRTYEVSQC